MATTTIKTSNQTGELDTRVGRLEGSVETLGTQVKEISNAVHELSDSLNSFQRDVLNTLSDVRTPKWPVIVGVGSTLFAFLTICAAVLTFLLSNQNGLISENKIAIASAQRVAYEERYEAGRLAEWKESTNTSIDRLDTNLQREMRDLDTALQREMRQQDAVIMIDIENISQLLHDLRNELSQATLQHADHLTHSDLTTYIMPSQKEHDERLRVLETKIAETSRIVEDIRAEQLRRTAKVYGPTPEN